MQLMVSGVRVAFDLRSRTFSCCCCCTRPVGCITCKIKEWFALILIANRLASLTPAQCVCAQERKQSSSSSSLSPTTTTTSKCDAHSTIWKQREKKCCRQSNNLEQEANREFDVANDNARKNCLNEREKLKQLGRQPLKTQGAFVCLPLLATHTHTHNTQHTMIMRFRKLAAGKKFCPFDWSSSSSVS